MAENRFAQVRGGVRTHAEQQRENAMTTINEIEFGELLFQQPGQGHPQGGGGGGGGDGDGGSAAGCGGCGGSGSGSGACGSGSGGCGSDSA